MNLGNRASQHCCFALVSLVLTISSVAESQAGQRAAQPLAPSRAAARVGVGRVSLQSDISRRTNVTSRGSALEASSATDPSRSKVIAGLASGIIPGVGSFYAANVRHGFIHLTVHVVAGTLALAGSVSCIATWGGETDCNDGGTQLAAAVWLVNWGWSIITAVNDAGAFNTRKSVR